MDVFASDAHGDSPLPAPTADVMVSGDPVPGLGSGPSALQRDMLPLRSRARSFDLWTASSSKVCLHLLRQYRTNVLQSCSVCPKDIDPTRPGITPLTPSRPEEYEQCA